MVYVSEYSSPIGKMTIASDKTNITGLWFEGQEGFLSRLKEKPSCGDNLPAVISAKKWLDSYFAGENPSPAALPIKTEGSNFQKTVWDILLTIPYGETLTYGEIARRISEKRGAKTSARAVGGAVHRNPISIIIPCHRVIGADKSLTGYAGGLPLKVFLLNLEGAKFKKEK